MSGGNQSKIKIVLRNPLNFKDQIDYTINAFDNKLAQDWIPALKEILTSNKMLEKNFCFMGFPNTPRTIDFLCNELNSHISTINNFYKDYKIDKVYTEELLHTNYNPNHESLNELHNHFEILQGIVWELSDYYKRADYETKYAIRQLNNLCHEIENLILSKRKQASLPYWVRPSQITTFLNAKRYDLIDEHRELFIENGYDRVLGGVYMHWCQIGKTYFEVWRDEKAPKLTDTVCQAITDLRYYSGEFDIEWGNNVVYPGEHPWHNKEQEEFGNWLIENNLDPKDKKLSLGYLPIGQVDLVKSFGTADYKTIWQILENHLDIYKIEIDNVSQCYPYCWSDANYKNLQIDVMRPGYDYSSRG